MRVPVGRATGRVPLKETIGFTLDLVDTKKEIRDFLTSRRARITPEQAGLRSYGSRRVPGLRREEVAVLAGVSVPYYTRLERGDMSGDSASVLEAPAWAPEFVDAERAHPLELATHSELFRTRWAAHDVRFHNTGVKQFHHPVVEELNLSFNRLDLPADQGLTIFTYAAEPGSRSEEALRLLGSWAATADPAESAQATDQAQVERDTRSA